jgi:hypothetical protein
MKSEGVGIAPLGREPGLIAYKCLECKYVTKRASRLALPCADIAVMIFSNAR